MADTKLSALTALAVEPADADEVYINDGGTSKRITYGVLKAALLARANHTGTQLAATISDFATTVGADSAVAANTSKVTNATHTGQVTGSGALTVDTSAISDQSLVTVTSGDFILILDSSTSPMTLAKIVASDFATAAQGGLADSALQTADIDTLAELNALIGDATLIDTADARLSDARTPTTHTHEGSTILSSSTSPLTTAGYVLTADGAGGADWAASVGAGDLLADGTIPLTADWDVGTFKITANQFESDVATGTAPFVVASTTQVANLNAATAGNADTVTTNANLTGHVTSVGNATTLNSFTKAQLSTAVSDGTVLYSGDVTTNATHTGDATGATALTLQAAAISGKSTATAASGDYILVLDTSDSPNALKKALISDIHPTEFIAIACSDETTVLTAGTAKATFRMPYAFTLTAVKCSVTTATGAPSPIALLTVDINENTGSPSPDVGTSILSTKLTIDAGERTSTTAATPAVISDSALADDAEITIDIDVADGTSAGLKVYLIGTRT